MAEKTYHITRCDGCGKIVHTPPYDHDEEPGWYHLSRLTTNPEFDILSWDFCSFECINTWWHNQEVVALEE